MLGAFELLAALVAVLTAVLYLARRNVDYWQRRGVPYIKPTPFIGNSKEYIFATEFRGIVTQRFYQYARANGHSYLGIFLGQRPVLLATDVEFVKTIMVKDFQYFVDRGMFVDRQAEPLSVHLFNMRGSEWKALRAKLTPTFTSGKMKSMFPLVRACTEQLVEYLDQHVGRELEMSDAMARFTTDVIGSCAFGLDTNAMKDPNSEFRTMGRRVFEISWFRAAIGTIAEVLPQIRKILPVKPMRQDVSDFFTTMFNENVKLREKNKIVRNDFLDLLIQLRSKSGEGNKDSGIDDAILPAQAFIFFAAGFETSSGAMSNCLTELAYHPDVQERLREEVDRVLEKHNGQVTYEALQEMTYMEQVLEETMRLYPALANIPREVTRDYPLPDSKGAVLPKGTRVHIPVYAIHRDPDIYPDPDNFDPERFTEENKRSRPNYSYIPFGEGPRICIGLRFAWMQMKTGLTMVLRRYRVSPSEGTIYPMRMEAKNFVTKTLGNARLRLSAR